MPSAEQIKQFFLTVVLPPVVGIIAAWLIATVHVLNLFGITEGQVAGELSLLGAWGITTAITALAQHHILSGHYTPAAKAAAGIK
jgi:amino acid transporter